MSERQPITIVLSKAEQDGEIRAMRILMSRYQVEALKAWREIMAERERQASRMDARLDLLVDISSRVKLQSE